MIYGILLKKLFANCAILQKWESEWASIPVSVPLPISIVLWKFWGCPTYGQSIETSLEGEDENVPAGAEAGDGPACEEQAQEPEEGPDGVTLQ